MRAPALLYGGVGRTLIHTDSNVLAVLLCPVRKGRNTRIGPVIPTLYPSNLMQPSSWYALRTFNCQEQKVSRFLTDKGIPHFIPMTFGSDTANHPDNATLVPAVHNLLFMEKCGTAQQTASLLSQCPVPVSIFRLPGDKDYTEISGQEMSELRMLCDPRFTGSVFMTPTEADILVGKEVRVVQGPFKGSTGKLVRKNKLYYFLKVFVGMGVMVRISRWYCEAIQP